MARSCSCNDFNRAALLRRGAAIAGKGLPKIEPGMPVPAGTGLDRRTFLLASAGAALSVYGASMLSPRHFEEGIAQASADTGPDGPPVLVSIFMEGGWDALSVLAPVEGSASTTNCVPSSAWTQCARKRHGKTFTEDENLMWHPSAERSGRTARRGQGHRVPRDRLRAAGREPLHQPPLLGGRPARHQHAHRLDGALPRHRRRTHQPPAGPLPGLLARAGAGHRDDARRRGLLARRLHDVGGGPGRTRDRTGARNLRRAGRALGAVARVRPGTARLLRHRSRPQQDGRLRRIREEIGRQIAGHLPDGRIRRTARGARGDAPHGNADQMRLAERRRLLRHALRRGRARSPPTSNRPSPRWSPSSETSKSADWTTAC